MSRKSDQHAVTVVQPTENGLSLNDDTTGKVRSRKEHLVKKLNVNTRRISPFSFSLLRPKLTAFPVAPLSIRTTLSVQYLSACDFSGAKWRSVVADQLVRQKNCCCGSWATQIGDSVGVCRAMIARHTPPGALTASFILRAATKRGLLLARRQHRGRQKLGR